MKEEIAKLADIAKDIEGLMKLIDSQNDRIAQLEKELKEMRLLLLRLK